MHQWYDINPVYALSGLLVGILVGLTGTGGGSLMTPLLVFFGIHPTTAVGTDLLFTAITKIIGTLIHGFKGTVDWPLVGRLAAGSVPATVATVVFLSYNQNNLSLVKSLITTTLGVAVLVTAVSVMFRTWILKQAAGDGTPMSAQRSLVYTVVLGAVLGIVVTLTSVGAGAIGVTALLILYPAMPMGRLVGSDIAHAVPLTLIAGAMYCRMGSMDWPLLCSLLVGSIPGIIAGSLVSSRVPDKVIRPILSGILVVVGIKLFLK
jgi:uncharacterized membrane protein YfcA